MEWTTRSLANFRIPHVNFEDVALIDALVFASRIDVPKAYRVWLEYPGEMARSDVRLTLNAKDISWIELLGIIDANANLDLRIQPGLVTFVPRSGPSGQDQTPSATATPSASSDSDKTVRPPQSEETELERPPK